MKTPDEIKKGLALHRSTLGCDNICPYDGWNAETGSCIQRLMKDTVEYIEHLESRLAGACGVCAYNFTGDKSCLAHIKQLESRLAQVERERDAAVADLEDSADCEYCKNEPIFHTCPETNCHECERDCPCARCSARQSNGFEWRGVCNENTKEDADENTEKV